MNIVQRLLLIVLLSAVPLGILQMAHLRQDRQASLAESARIVLRTAARSSAEQRRIVKGTRQMLTALSQLPSLRERDLGRCGLILRRMQAQFPVYSAIGVSDPAGRIWCSSHQPGTDVSDRAFFHRVTTHRAFITGGYIVGRVTGRRTLNFSLPMEDEAGNLIGVLIAGLDLERLAADVAATPLPPRSTLVIAGPDRRILVSLPGGAQVGRALPRQFEAAFRAPTLGNLEARWFDGKDKLVGFVPPRADPDMPFLVMVALDRADVVAAANARAREATLLSLLVLVGALLTAWWFAARFVRRPLLQLASAAHAWREGAHGVRVGRIEPGSEFDALAHAFDGMAEAMEDRERRLRDVLESTTDSVVTVDPDWTLRFVNQRARVRTQREDLTGTCLWDAFPDLVCGPLWSALHQAMRERTPVTITLPYEPLQGCFEVNAFPAQQGGLVLFIRDITEQHRAQQELRHLAMHDPLTGLGNRTSAMEIAARRLADGRLSALILLDLDGFKHVNDSLGHAAGDMLLRQASQRLSSCLGGNGVVARLGGDEFVVLLFDTEPQQSEALAQALLACLAEAPFLVAGRPQQISSSAGLVLPDRQADDVDELLANADLALYAAKAAGGGLCRTYSADDRRSYEASRRLEEEIARAAAAGEFELHFQPQVRLADSALVGAEALLRWRHPQRGLLGPGAFLHVLDGSRHADLVGRWIIDEACRNLAIWRRGGSRVRVSVNLFAEQLAAEDLPERVRTALRRHHLPPEALELEVTENIALRRSDGIERSLMTLRMMGVRVAFDDFGTGFASLTTLKDLPVDRLKIDRSFVKDLPNDAHDRAIVEAVLALARTLDLEVVAEGVENEEQEQYLRSRGCREAQGYRYARPMAGPAFQLYMLNGAQKAVASRGRSTRLARGAPSASGV